MAAAREALEARKARKALEAREATKEVLFVTLWCACCLERAFRLLQSPAQDGREVFCCARACKNFERAFGALPVVVRGADCGLQVERESLQGWRQGWRVVEGFLRLVGQRGESFFCRLQPSLFDVERGVPNLCITSIEGRE